MPSILFVFEAPCSESCVAGGLVCLFVFWWKGVFVFLGENMFLGKHSWATLVCGLHFPLPKHPVQFFLVPKIKLFPFSFFLFVETFSPRQAQNEIAIKGAVCIVFSFANAVFSIIFWRTQSDLTLFVFENWFFLRFVFENWWDKQTTTWFCRPILWNLQPIVKSNLSPFIYILGPNIISSVISTFLSPFSRPQPNERDLCTWPLHQSPPPRWLSPPSQCDVLLTLPLISIWPNLYNKILIFMILNKYH